VNEAHPNAGSPNGASATAPHQWLNALDAVQAAAQLSRCCGAEQWVALVLSQRPFASLAALIQAADEASAALSEQDLLEAFSHHPEIGSDLDALRRKFQNTAALSVSEQAGVAGADEATLLALSAGNAAYKQRFGFLFIVCASGRSAAEMLALLQARLPNPRSIELQIAAAEHAKIARLRIEKLGPTTEHQRP
jgi:2-oxo-4-hydroxy-4-carboxy-5-ureidoimidazoline decarboxylase